NPPARMYRFVVSNREWRKWRWMACPARRSSRRWWRDLLAASGRRSWRRGALASSVVSGLYRKPDSAIMVMKFAKEQAKIRCGRKERSLPRCCDQNRGSSEESRSDTTAAGIALCLFDSGSDSCDHGGALWRNDVLLGKASGGFCVLKERESHGKG